jgi:peptide/nickel transport system substrate-binding protein
MAWTGWLNWIWHRWGRRSLLLSLAIVLVLTTTGCRTLIEQSRASDYSQMVLSILSDVKTFNPPLNQEFPNVFLLTYRGLTLEDGLTGEVKPELAESWEISPDQRRVTFTLREGLRWSDGEPLTVDDVVFTYRDVIFNDKIPTDHRDGFRIGEAGTLPTVEKVSDRQVAFVLPEPFSPLLRATVGPPTSGGLAILPKHILEDAVTTKDSNGNPLFLSTWDTNTDPSQLVVNGPYRVQSYVPGQRLIFERNPYFWQTDDQGASMPYIDRVVWKVVESTDTGLLQFRSGGLDAIGDTRPMKPEYFSLLKREEERGRFQVLNGGPWSGTTFVAFNLNQATNAQGRPFVDPVKANWFQRQGFRQAIAHAIHRDRIVNNVYRGISAPQNSPISVQSPYYLSPEEGLPTYEYDLNQARALLEAEGFQYNAQGQLLDPEGNRVSFSLETNAGNTIREFIGAQIKTDLSLLGIQVDFRPIDFGTLVSKLTQGRSWDMILIGFTGGIEPHSGSNLWKSTGGSHLFNLGPQPGQEPIQNWVVSDWERRIDQLFDAGAREFDEARRKQIYAEYQRIVQEQLPVVYLVNEIALIAVRDRIQGLKFSGLPSWGLWNIHELWVDDQRHQDAQ